MKRISTILLAISIIISCLAPTMVFADTPIIPNSSFTKGSGGWSTVGGKFSLENNDAVSSTGKCFKGTKTNATEITDFRCENVRMEPGKAYVLTFYAKSDVEGMVFRIIRTHAGARWTYLPTVSLTTKWEKYEVEFVHPFKDDQGTTVGEEGTLMLRIDALGSVWLDEVNVIDPSKIVEETKPVGDAYQPYVYEPQQTKIEFSPFDDTIGHWAQTTISIARNEGMVRGVGDNLFEPERSVTRAEFLNMAMSIFNVEDNPYKDVYQDVYAGDWYAGVVQNAHYLSIIDPALINNNCFNPNVPITREDACMLAMGAWKAKNPNQSIPETELSAFVDDNSISAYARNNLYDATKLGIINGYEDKTVIPQGTLTRAEAVQILFNLVSSDGIMAVYVDSENGNDAGDGTLASPFKSIQKAINVVRQNTTEMSHSIYVLIKAGEIYVDSPITLTPADSGTDRYKIVFTSYGDGQAILSGGKHFNGGWQVDDAQKGIYKMFVGDIQTRQMFVDGVRMQRARTTNAFETKSFINDDKTGYITSDTYFKKMKNVNGLEFVYYMDWTNPRCCVDSVEVNKDGTATVLMQDPCWTYLMNKAHLTVDMPDYFENQYEFIDQPGEWYLNEKGWLFFKPYPYMNLDTVDVVLPTTENLFSAMGSPAEQINNIALINLGFEYATWMRPSTGAGYTDAQGGRIREGSDKVPDAAVTIKYANNITIMDCDFSRMGKTALNVIDKVENIDIIGNHIYDLSGAGMYVGNHGTEGGAIGDDNISKNIVIKNNLVHDYGIDYRSSDGVECMTMRDAKIEHNEVYNGNYSGLVLGYGASGTKVNLSYSYNYVHDILTGPLFDGGGIYVTQQTGGSEDNRNQMTYNYIENQGNVTGCLYTDNNSTYWEVAHNVVDQTRRPFWYYYHGNPIRARWYMSNGLEGNLAHHNYTTTESYTVSGVYSNGEVDVEMYDNTVCPNTQWPQEALDIISNAGLEANYLEKFKDEGKTVGIIENETVELTRDRAVSAVDLLKLQLHGRKNEVLELDPKSVFVTTDIPDCISIDDNNMISCIGAGTGNLFATVKLGSVLQQYVVPVIAGDSYNDVKLNKTSISVYEGASTQLEALATSEFGNSRKADSVTYTISDASVATIDDNGVVIGNTTGKATINANVTYGDIMKSFTVPVVVKSKNFSPEFNLTDYIVTSLDELIESENLWVSSNSRDSATRTADGMEFKSPSNNVASSWKYGEDLLHTKLTINATGGWPSIAIRAQSQKAAYSDNTEYMVTFYQDRLEIQRFIGGTRKTYPELTYPIAFEYGKTYDLVMGAINHEDNVELVVCIDGVPYMRFYDYDEERITDAGYIQVYSRSGNITLSKVE